MNLKVVFPFFLAALTIGGSATTAFSSSSSSKRYQRQQQQQQQQQQVAPMYATANEKVEDGANLMITRRNAVLSTAAMIPAVASILTGMPRPASARLEAVNRPDLLPKESGLNVIQTEKFLTSGQAKRLDTMIQNLENDTGFRLRVLCQNYPNTPGLAIRDYWDLGKEGQKDDKYIVLVVDEFGGKANVLNFNVGDGVKFALPNVFWTRLSGKYGTKFYVRDNGIDLAITNAVEGIVSCLRSEDGYCTSPPEEAESLKGLGFR